MTNVPGPKSTLAAAKAWLRQRVGDGAHCPCCGQYAKLYKRKLTKSQISTLAAMAKRQAQAEDRQSQSGARLGQATWIHLPEIPQRSRDFATVAYFDLAEEERIRRPDGGRAGWWRVTAKGFDYLQGLASTPRYAKVYNGRCIGFEGPDTYVHEIAPEFNFAHLMAGV